MLRVDELLLCWRVELLFNYVYVTAGECLLPVAGAMELARAQMMMSWRPQFMPILES